MTISSQRFEDDKAVKPPSFWILRDLTASSGFPCCFFPNSFMFLGGPWTCGRRPYVSVALAAPGTWPSQRSCVRVTWKNGLISRSTAMSWWDGHRRGSHRASKSLKASRSWKLKASFGGSEFLSLNELGTKALVYACLDTSTAFQSASRTCTASCTCVSLGMCWTCASKRASKDVQKFTSWWFQIQLFHPAARADILAPAQLTCNFYTPSSCTNHSISGVWDPRAMRSGGQNGCVAKLNFSYFFGFLGVAALYPPCAYWIW